MDQYDILKKLGSGSFGTCVLCRRKDTRELWAIKQIDITGFSKKERAAVIKEMEVQQKLKHPNIVRFRGAFYTDNTSINIVMDYCPDGDLGERIKRQKGCLFDERTIMDWFVQMCAGLAYMHGQKIMHRDVKAQNIFLARGGVHLKIGDFGISRVLETQEKAETVIGTPYYLSPEIFSKQPYSYSSDIWALGCLLYQLCQLRHPFEAASFPELAVKVSTGKYAMMSGVYSQQAHSLVRELLCQNPDRRPSCKQILARPHIKDHVDDFVCRTEKLHPAVRNSEPLMEAKPNVYRLSHGPSRSRSRPSSRSPSPAPAAHPAPAAQAAAPEPEKGRGELEFEAVLSQLTQGANELSEPVAKEIPKDDKATVYQLDLLAKHIEDKMTTEMFQGILTKLRNFPAGDESRIATEIVALIGDKNLEHMDLLWEYVSLESQFF